MWEADAKILLTLEKELERKPKSKDFVYPYWLYTLTKSTIKLHEM